MTDNAKQKRKYTKTPRWTVNGVEHTGLVEALRTSNELLRSGEADEVTIARIKKAKSDAEE